MTTPQDQVKSLDLAITLGYSRAAFEIVRGEGPNEATDQLIEEAIRRLDRTIAWMCQESVTIDISTRTEPGKAVVLCPHDNLPHECEACMVQSDFAHDAAREQR